VCYEINEKSCTADNGTDSFLFHAILPAHYSKKILCAVCNNITGSYTEQSVAE
jgi:hypothetical protein